MMKMRRTMEKINIMTSTQCWLIFTMLISAFIASASTSSSSSSSSSFHNSNYNVYQYDRTSSHFTPDGRLMQVEYARSAADHSSPLIVFQYNDNKEKNDDQLLILLTLKRGPGSSPTTGGSQFLQERLVVLQENECIIVLSGILSDCTFLLQKLQEEDLQHRRLYGGCAFNSPLKIASCLSLACQKHAIGGGIRPFGSTFYIASHQRTAALQVPPSSSSSSSPFQLYRTDPSGAVQSLPVGSGAGTGDDTSASFPTGIVCPSPLILGGELVEGTDRLRRRLTSEWSRLPKDTVAAMIISVTRILLQEQQSKTSSTSSASASPSSTTDTSIQPPPPSSLEVAVISAKHGLYKLSETQIKDILQKACRAVESTKR